MSKSRMYRATADLARKHSGISTVAAAAAAAGVLGAAGYAGGTAPWAQAFDNVTATVAGDAPTTPGLATNGVFQAVTGTTASRQAPGGQLAATGGSVAAAPATGNKTGANQVVAVPADNPKRPAPKAQPAKKPKAVHGKAAKPKAKPTARHRPAEPFLIYDSVTPGSLPHGKAAAVYTNGAYAAHPSQVRGHKSVLWIDVNGSNPGANVLDVEPGDATPAAAAEWVKHRLHSHPHGIAIVYTMRSDWLEVRQHVGHLPAWMRSKVRYWIADPTGSPHVVAGSSATQWYWGSHFDITTAKPNLMH